MGHAVGRGLRRPSGTCVAPALTRPRKRPRLVARPCVRADRRGVADARGSTGQRLEQRQPTAGAQHASEGAQRGAALADVDQHRSQYHGIDRAVSDRLERHRVGLHGPHPVAVAGGLGPCPLQRSRRGVGEDHRTRGRDVLDRGESEQPLPRPDIEHRVPVAEPRPSTRSPTGARNASACARSSSLAASHRSRRSPADGDRPGRAARRPCALRRPGQSLLTLEACQLKRHGCRPVLWGPSLSQSQFVPHRDPQLRRATTSCRSSSTSCSTAPSGERSAGRRAHQRVTKWPIFVTI